MKKFFSFLLLLGTLAQAAMFQTVEPHQTKLLQKGDNARYCNSCGMDLVLFYKTSHAAKVNGKTKQFCSMHCLAETMQKVKNITDIKVVDAKSLKWIDAKKAYYVVGSRVKGTMSRTSKYAFKNLSDAKEFQRLRGGKIMTFNQALEIAKKDFQ